MRKFAWLTAVIVLAALLLSACGEVKIESITLSQNAVELKEGETAALSAIVAPESATEGYSWKSADESIATVDENGAVTAVAPGNTNILAVSESGKTAACSVTVVAPTAYELLNDAERKMFDYMVNTMLTDFYNAPAARVRRIYQNTVTEQGVILDLQGTNKMGGTFFKMFSVFFMEEKTFSIVCNTEPDLSQPMPVEQMDPAKINAALEEHWDNAGMTG